MIITGKNKNFHAVWDCNAQKYSVYKGDRFIITLYSMRLVKNYID